jgi:hypothetical protein
MATRFVVPSTLERDIALLSAALLAVEVSLAVLLFGLHKASSQIMLIGGLGVFSSSVLVVRQTVRLRRDNARMFHLAVAANLIFVCAAFLLGEAGLRVWFAADSAFAERLPKGLLPLDWESKSAENRRLIEDRAPGGQWDQSYIVYDDLLGWTVGPNRQSKDGLYASSVQGIRSTEPGFSYSDGVGRRIALIGDSYTFSKDVSYEESLGYHLDQQLGEDYQVLNFGVDGYGIDQAFLRYCRDVRPWRPEVVIFSMIAHDFARTEAVYAFVSFPTWQLPFAKPRFRVSQGELELLNVPVPEPGWIFSRPAITDLPYLDLDPGFFPYDWHWRSYHHSVLIRTLLSLSPRWKSESDPTSTELVAVNQALLREFRRIALAEGSIPLVVYLPTKGAADFEADVVSTGHRAAQDALDASGVDYLDLTECVARVPEADRYAYTGIHYSGATNAAVATCLTQTLNDAL